MHGTAAAELSSWLSEFSADEYSDLSASSVSIVTHGDQGSIIVFDGELSL